MKSGVSKVFSITEVESRAAGNLGVDMSRRAKMGTMHDSCIKYHS